VAVNKKIENEYGAEFQYHKIRDVRITNTEAGIQLVMTVDSYLDKQARIAGKSPTTRQCIISGADFAMTPFYALLKAKFPEFVTAVDDMDNSFKQDQPKQDIQYIEQSSDYTMVNSWKEGE